MNLELLRTLIDDTDPENQKFSDEQLMSFLQLESNIYLAAAAACQSLASKFASNKKVNVRGISVENQQIYDHYLELAKQYTLWGNQGRGDEISSDGSGTIKSRYGRPIVTGTTVSGIKEAQADIDRVPDVFPKPVSDVGCNERYSNCAGFKGC